VYRRLAADSRRAALPTAGRSATGNGARADGRALTAGTS
jgi:hypothetical protein